MRPGMQFLLDLLRGQAKTLSVTDAEWMVVLRLAEQENVLPWTATCLRTALGAACSEQLSEKLDSIDRNARVSAFLWNATLKNTLGEFHSRGIPVISFKGPWMAERLYGDCRLRLYSDLDLLVREADLISAENLLTGLGFVPAGRCIDYQRRWHRDGLTVELHHDFENPLMFDFGIEGVWNRACHSQFQGVPARVLAPSDELLFLCLHGVRHLYERVSHILDLTFAFKCLPLPDFNVRTVRDSEADRILVLGWMMARRLDPLVPSAEDIYGLIPDWKKLEQVANELWKERMVQPADVLTWRAKHRFFLRIEESSRRRLLTRMRHLRILATRLVDDDFAFAEHFNLHRSWQVWLLRPVRLVMKTLRTSPAPP